MNRQRLRTRDPHERTLELLRRIQTGQTDPVTIGLSERRLLVAYLMGDGYSTAEMAQVLKVSDRSIERDKRAIRESNAIPKDTGLAEQMVGRLVTEAELSVQRIRRTAREKSVNPAVRIDAEQRCYSIISDLVQRLQGLGYLPTASQKVEADLTHHVGDVPSLDDLQIEVRRIKRLASEHAGGDVPGEVIELEQRLLRAGLATEVERAARQIASPPDESEALDEGGSD